MTQSLVSNFYFDIPVHKISFWTHSFNFPARFFVGEFIWADELSCFMEAGDIMPINRMPTDLSIEAIREFLYASGCVFKVVRVSHDIAEKDSIQMHCIQYKLIPAEKTDEI